MSETITILLIEDDPNLGYLIKENLEERGFSVVLCVDGEDGKQTFFERPFHLCLLDVMLPRKDGFTLAREIRKVNQQTPILFLTARSLKEDRIEGFRIGGDDYITKPFSMEELVLRIHAVLKRTLGAAEATAESKFTLGAYTFDHERQTLTFGGEACRKLTHKESELLRLLCQHENSVLDRSLALNLVWGEDTFFAGRSMDVFVSRLRKYLGKDPNLEIVNVHGRGFKLMVSRSG